jgi:hypothetical protein
MATKSYIIALEEHYYDPEVKRHASGLDAIAAPVTLQRLDDMGELRLQEMDGRHRPAGVVTYDVGVSEARC